MVTGTTDSMGTSSPLMRATSAAAQSKYERIVRMVQEAQGERAPINRLANRFAPAMTLVTLVTAAAVLLLTHNPVRALAVLVVATPCPLILAAPTARLIKSGVRGIVPEQSAVKLRRSAEIALEEFGGDLKAILKLPLAKAKKALKRFPAIARATSVSDSNAGSVVVW